MSVGEMTAKVVKKIGQRLIDDVIEADPILRRLRDIGDAAKAVKKTGQRQGETMGPTKRGHCQGEGLCPFARCRYNLAVDVSSSGALLVSGQRAMTLKPRRYDFEQWSDVLTDSMVDASVSCALDVADSGEHTLTEIGALLGVCRERARQIEESALEKLRALMGEDEVMAMLADAQAPGIAAFALHRDFSERGEPC